MKIAWLTSAWLLPTMFLIAACGGGEPTPTIAHAVEWGYQGPGAPENWASLSDDYARLAPKASANLPSTSPDTSRTTPRLISFSYGGDANAVRNKGKFVYVDYAPGAAFNVGERTFKLNSAHLHSPSEHLDRRSELCSRAALGTPGRPRRRWLWWGCCSDWESPAP